MALKRCEGLDRQRKECRSRNNKAVWLVDGKHLYCLSCFETFLATHALEDHRVVRLSDNERDFSETSRIATARA